MKIRDSDTSLFVIIDCYFVIVIFRDSDTSLFVIIHCYFVIVKKTQTIKKTKTKIRIASWNLGDIKKRNWEVVETVKNMCRHLWCAGIQVYRFPWIQHGSFHLPLGVCTFSGPTWTWKGTFLWPAAIHCYQGLSHWDIPVGDWTGQICTLVSVFRDAHGGHRFGAYNKKVRKFWISP